MTAQSWQAAKQLWRLQLPRASAASEAGPALGLASVGRCEPGAASVASTHGPLAPPFVAHVNALTEPQKQAKPSQPATRAQATISKQPGVAAQAVTSSSHVSQRQVPQASPPLEHRAGTAGAPLSATGPDDAAPASPVGPLGAGPGPSPEALPFDGSELLTGPDTLIVASEPPAADAPTPFTPPAPLPTAPASLSALPAPPAELPALATSVVHGSVSHRSDASPTPSKELHDSTPSRLQKNQPKLATGAMARGKDVSMTERSIGRDAATVRATSARRKVPRR